MAASRTKPSSRETSVPAPTSTAFLAEEDGERAAFAKKGRLSPPPPSFGEGFGLFGRAVFNESRFSAIGNTRDKEGSHGKRWRTGGAGVGEPCSPAHGRPRL